MDDHEGRLSEALILEDDLFFSVRIEKTLQRLGYRTVVCNAAEDAVRRLDAGGIGLVVMNFGSVAQQPGVVATSAKSRPNPPVVLGYVSHGEIPVLRAASRAAGCDLLVANSVIVMRLPQLVERLRAKLGSDHGFDDLEEDTSGEPVH